MLLSIISLVSGFILLIWSADVFTNNGAKIARIFNISPLVIGLLIFGFGTSAPEMLVSGIAAYSGHPEMSVGNAFGSNIFNIGLVLG
ncbi:MAG TPA: calcium/sodium antiporter, partial [Candidatus Thioglobus sp.]|nr:calcium/sodium antiporter [Candidatus Thioglobus sp.]